MKWFGIKRKVLLTDGESYSVVAKWFQFFFLQLSYDVKIIQHTPEHINCRCKSTVTRSRGNKKN